MKKVAQEANAAYFEFELSGFFKVTFKRNEADVLSGRQSVVNRSQSDTLSDRKEAIISFLEEHGRAKAIDFANVIGLSDGRVRALLREMVSDGTIEKVGNNRYAYYVLK
ncbi:MAG: winged helix-turn-helix transcriptional regulator [Synergistaceae bacterium]|nr:winged helix-turn-helix transcriptional regulator [Synergistaceae bacterium]